MTSLDDELSIGGRMMGVSLFVLLHGIVMLESATKVVGTE